LSSLTRCSNAVTRACAALSCIVVSLLSLRNCADSASAACTRSPTAARRPPKFFQFTAEKAIAPMATISATPANQPPRLTTGGVDTVGAVDALGAADAGAVVGLGSAGFTSSTEGCVIRSQCHIGLWNPHCRAMALCHQLAGADQKRCRASMTSAMTGRHTETVCHPAVRAESAMRLWVHTSRRFHSRW